MTYAFFGVIISQPSKTNSNDKKFILRDDHSDIFLANHIEITDSEKVYNHVIPTGYGKYLIIKVLKATWQKFDENIHCPGSYITWKDDNTLSSQMINFYTDDDEGIMSGTAGTIEVLQLKQGSKRKSQPESWEKNKKRKYVQSGKGKKTNESCKCKLKCFEKVTEEESQEVFNQY